MTYFMQLRDLVRNFISKNEVAVLRVFKAVMALVCIGVIRSNFDYAEVLRHSWIGFAIAVLCAFVSASAYTLILAVYLFIELLSLNVVVAFVTLGLILLSILLSAIYRGTHYHNLMGTPVGYFIHLPYVTPMISALYGRSSEVVTVLCGGIITYFLKSVKEHATQLMDSAEGIQVSELLMDGMVSNVMFYVFLLALVVMFLVVYVIRCNHISYGWTVAVVSGTVSEFIILLSGYLILNRTSQIPWLIGGNLITLLVGLFTSYFIFDLDYHRAEKVQFEDDEYYYYVTAIPKVRVEKEEKEVKKITEGDPSARRSRMNYTRDSRLKKRGKKVTRV